MMNVKNNKFALLLAASAVSIALSGCGDDGKDGTPGTPGGEPAQAINTLNLDVTNVTYTDGVPTVTVFATNEDDFPVIGLKDLEIKKAVQLIPQGATGAGNSAQWQFIGSQKAFTDHKDGNYSFTIDVDGYDSELTQRYNIIAKASTLLDGVTSVPQTEIVEDFSGEGLEPLYTKNIVSMDSCITCHGEGQNIYHGYSLTTCISCHTQELADSKGKPQVAFNHLIHNVHNDAKMYGRDLDTSAETAHNIVQDNCQACHVESEELTEWGNWSRVPTMETCTSCHVNIDFKAGQGHSQQNDNSNCIACHNASWTETIHTANATQKKALIDQYGINVESTVDASTQAATISIAVVDAAGNAVDISTILPKVQRFEVVTNVGPNNVTSEKAAVDVVKNGVLNGAHITDGKLIYTTNKLTFGTTAGADDDTAFTFVGWAMCSTNGEFVNCNDDFSATSKDISSYTSMKAGLAFATLSGEAPSTRHVDSVEFNTCANCHTAEFEVHKSEKGYHVGFVMSEQVAHSTDADGNAIIGVDACVVCHTANGTYPGRQGAFEVKLHAVHGPEAIIKDCSQCHNDFNLDSFQKKGAIEINASYSTPIAATCGSCHTSDSFKAHAASQGAIIDGDKAEVTVAAQLETCFLCHAPVIENHTKVKM